jgi:hypothetical protein
MLEMDSVTRSSTAEGGRQENQGLRKKWHEANEPRSGAF